MIPRAALPVLLIKLRTQYGLRRFAKIGIILYTLVALVAAEPLSTLAFPSMLEPLSRQAKMILGLPLAMVVLMTGLSLALMSLTLVFCLPLRPVPRAKVLDRWISSALR